MQTRLLALFLGLTVPFCWGADESPGFLRAKDARIVDGQGREVLLRGMGLGGWMLQEGYMLGLQKEGTQHSIRSRITDLIGQEDCDRFYQLWLQNHMTRADVDLLARCGFNSIRLPMHYNLFTLPSEQEPIPGQNTWLETGFGLVDNLLRPLLVGKDTGLPDYLVLLSTLGGMALFGLTGFVIGPVVAALFIAVGLVRGMFDGYGIPQNWLVDPKGNWIATQIGFDAAETDWVNSMLKRLDGAKQGKAPAGTE